MSIGEKIKVIRKERKISQYDLAEMVRVLNQSQISKIEKGGRKVTETDLKEIAEALNVSIGELIS